MRNSFVILVLITLTLCYFTSCLEGERTDAHIFTINDTSVKKLTDQVDSSSLYLFADTVEVQGDVFVAAMNAFNVFILLKNQIDTLILDSTLSPEFEFADFDEDGFSDLNFYINKNIQLRQLYLYDPKSASFKFVEGFEDYPEPIRIKKTEYYYSYHRSGCADLNWDSDLFTIKDYTTIKLGNISGRGCGGLKDEATSINIYRVKGGKKHLFEQLPIKLAFQHKDLKWGFIEDYWSKNYRFFLIERSGKANN